MEKSEIYSDIPHTQRRVLLACDATKDRSKREFNYTISNIRSRGGIIEAGDIITVLGVVHKILHPMGYQMKIGHGPFFGTHVRAMEEEFSRKIDSYVNMLRHSAEECEADGVEIEAKITVGGPIKKVIAKEVATSNAMWVILDRHLKREVKFYLKHTPCKVALVRDDLTLEVLRPHSSQRDVGDIEHVLFYSLSKPVEPISDQENETITTPILSINSDETFSTLEGSNITKNSSISIFTHNSNDHSFYSPEGSSQTTTPEKSGGNVEEESNYVPVLTTADGMKNGEDSTRFSFAEIQVATNGFSSENLLLEGSYEVSYKGQLDNKQLVTAKVLKELSTKWSTVFHSEVYDLSLARHKNIVTLLGYCCEENVSILVYEYISSKSLEWHLFDNTDRVLEWQERRAVAIGIAQGLCYLHEECLGCPIIYQDMQPSNILLTHDFVPMLGDLGLSKWKLEQLDRQTQIVGTPGYVGPEYMEIGIVSLKTDVYAYGVVLLQLITGRRVEDSPSESCQHGHRHSLRQWALLMIETLALDQLVDPRLGDSYRMYELYHMARTAYLCVQADPTMRPSMGEVLGLLDGKHDSFL